MTFKGNQPGFYRQANPFPLDQVPVGDLQENTSQDRLVQRELKVITLARVLASTWSGAKRSKNEDTTVEVV